jgi:hypothetical protein
MTTIFTTIISALIVPIIDFLKEKIFAIVCKVNKKSVLIAYPEPLLVNSLTSTDSMLINLDDEIHSTMDDDEKAQTSTSAMINARIVYTKSVVVMKELLDVIIHSSKMVDKFVFTSCDYNLLKYGDAGNILYTLPSEIYYNILKQDPAWNDVKYQKVKNGLLARKANKIVIYSSFEELQGIICKNFNFKLKC